MSKTIAAWSTVASICASYASGEPTTASFWWEVSLDNGSTWTASNIEVTTEQQYIWLRARSSFVSDDWRTIFGRVFFDPFVSGASQGDDIDQWSYEEMNWAIRPTVRHRLGNLIKLDQPNDVQPPGLGSGGLTPFQPIPILTYDYDRNNPVTVFSFRLALDGVPGTREVSCALMHLNADNAPDRYTLVWSRGASTEWTGYMLPTSSSPPLAITITTCSADLDNGMGLGIPDGGVTIDDLLYYLDLYTQGVERADLDDGTGLGNPDGGVDVNDLLYFLLRLEIGC